MQQCSMKYRVKLDRVITALDYMYIWHIFTQAKSSDDFPSNWIPQVTSHYLNQCWSIFMTPQLVRKQIFSKYCIPLYVTNGNAIQQATG